MFDQLRASIRTLLDNATPPADRRETVYALKEALVHARLGVGDLRTAVAEARARAEAGRAELDTIRRRKALAAGIHDAETVTVAERFEALQAERVEVLGRKLDAQERELALAERELAEMSADFRRAVSGIDRGAPAMGGDPHQHAANAEVDALLGDDDGMDRERRAAARAQRSSDADARLAELKRRMGK